MNIIFIENDNFTVTDVAYCYYKIMTKNYTYKYDNRPMHGLVFVISGEMVFTFCDDEYALQKGEIFVLQQNDKYSMRISGEKTLQLQ